MALNYCTGCTTAYALDLLACPHCRQPANTVVTELEPPARPADAEPAKRRARREQPTGETDTAGTDG